MSSNSSGNKVTDPEASFSTNLLINYSSLSSIKALREPPCQKLPSFFFEKIIIKKKKDFSI